MNELQNFVVTLYVLIHLPEPIGVSLLQHNLSGSVMSGDSVTLNCTVHNVISHKDHKVYWFRQDLKTSSGSLGALYVYTNVNNGHCMQSLGSAEKRCEYSLSKRNVSMSDAGMFYCGLASCGKILFGKGTKLDVAGELNNNFLLVTLNKKYCPAA